MSGDLYDNVKYLTKNIVQLEEQIKILNEKINNYKKTKNAIEKKLIKNMKMSNLSDKAITYQNKKVYIHNDKSYDVLTFKFLEECFMDIYKGNQTTVKNLIEFIKNKRKRKINEIIKIK